MKTKSLWLLMVMLLSLTTIAAACGGGGNDDNASTATGLSVGPQAGKLAPDFSLPLIDGGKVTLSELRGKPVMINFWTTWCPACREEMPDLVSVYKEYAGKGLMMLAVDVGEKTSVVMDYVKEIGLSLPVLLDSNSDVARRYRVVGYPTTILIDRQGVIQEVRIGAFKDAPDVKAHLKKIM